VRTQDKHSEIAGDCFLEEWSPGELDYYLDRYAPSKRRRLERLGLLSLKGRLVLDGGCGPGTFGVILAETNQVVGIDISGRSVRSANKRARDARASFVALVGDLELLPFRSETFDICFCGWVLHHFPEVEPVIRELKRVLKPEGILAFVEPNEGSIAMRVSRFFEDRFQKFVLASAIDTPSRNVHSAAYYAAVLRELGFRDVSFGACYSGEVPALPRSSREKLGFWTVSAIKLVLGVRHLFFRLSEKLLPQPFNGVDLLITARKCGESDSAAP